MENSNLDKFKYNITKISLLLAITISFTFFILRVFDLIPSKSIATVNTAGLLFFLITIYICLLKCKEKIHVIHSVTYFVIITFILIQTVLTTYNIFLPVWIDFAILSAYIITFRPIAVIISIYSFLGLSLLKSSGLYNVDIFSFITLLMSVLAFSMLGFLISIQLEQYDKINVEQNNKLKKLALIDELTQIFNRRAFFDISQKILKQAKRDKTNVAIIMMDLDHFKYINDTYGHEAGDVVLKTFVNTINKIIRENDIFARIGGEEFVIMTYNIRLAHLHALVNKILTNIRNLKIPYQGHNIKITVSIGVYNIPPEENISLQNALINADKALYVAKKTGRDKAVFY